jgi:amino acid transporter
VGLLFHTLRELLIGSPLPTYRLSHERLDKVRALAILSPDALSSIAYANQEIYLGLVIAGAAGLTLSINIAVAIAILLALLAISYTQTIGAYPNGGGSYVVAHENLGQTLGLIAAAALMIDYVLTAAVSLTAGVAAIASAFPGLWDYRTPIALVLLVIITLANLRGLRESGTFIAIPVYLFILSYIGMLVYGLVIAATDGAGSLEKTAPPATESVTLLLILHTFASGCTALTGVEAISNGVPVFKKPEIKNARQVMGVMALIMGFLFVASIGLTEYLAVIPKADETVLSALAHRILGSGPLYYVVQISTLLILAVAANTSFADFPRVASILAKDGYAPRQLSFLGDRLVFSNGMMLLASLTGVLIVVFHGDSHALVPLFAVGVFIAFTLSQTGMVVHWWRERGRGWYIKALINGLGAIATTVTLFVVAISKFTHGAWIVLVLIPILVAFFRSTKYHYHQISSELTLKDLAPNASIPISSPRVVLPISGVHKGVLVALSYACSISDKVTALYVEINPGDADHVREIWAQYGRNVPLAVVPSPYRSIVGPILEFLDQTDREHNDGQQATLILPEFVPHKWWQNLLHNQTAWMLKLAILYGRHRQGQPRVIIDVPMYLRK